MGGASGAGGAPITMCGGCELTSEDFGEGCSVWACFGAGDGSQRLYQAGCEPLPTQVPRFCCPEDIELDCDDT